MNEYPEHIRQREVLEVSQAIGEFLDFGLEQIAEKLGFEGGLFLATQEDGRIYPAHPGIQNMLAAYFDIDLKKIDEEKDAMLEELRELQGIK